MTPRIDVRLFTTLVAGLAILASPNDLRAQPQSKDQQKCVNTSNKDGAKVAATQGKENVACIKNAGKGSDADPDGCLTRDGKGKVAKAAAKTGADFDKNCVVAPPDFGLPGVPAGTTAGLAAGTAAAVVRAAIDEEVQLVFDVFGSPLSAAIVTDKAGAKCQAAVSKDYEKTAATYMKGFLKCKKNALKGGADGAEDLQACILDDPGGKAASSAGKLTADIDKNCADHLFPGRCADAPLASLGDCVHRLVRCGICRMQNGMDGLRVDCDAADDGANNASCDPLATIGPLTLIQQGFLFTEGPRWSTADNVLLFTDVARSTIYRLTLPNTIDVVNSATNGANGLAFDIDGSLLACELAGRRVTRTDADGVVSVVADEFAGQPLTAPNDLVVRSDGTIYFTDPAYDATGPAAPVSRIFRVDPQGALFLVAEFTSLDYPNGIELSPDESILYASDVQGPIRAWDVAADGTTSGQRLFGQAIIGDGTAMDVAGNLYVTSVAGVTVFDPDGRSWGAIPVPRLPTNCAFGGPDNKTLFITAREFLYSVEMTVPGIP